MEYTLDDFALRFKTLQEEWGYFYPGGSHSAYELKTHSNGFREFQYLTDYIMRFLANGFSNISDAKTLKIEYNFYREGSEYNMPDSKLTQYLEEIGPFFAKHRQMCTDAYEYIKLCPQSRERCFLQVSLQWMKTIRLYYKKFRKNKPVTVKRFKQSLKAKAIRECREYMRTQHEHTLDVNSVDEAIDEVVDFYYRNEVSLESEFETDRVRLRL